MPLQPYQSGMDETNLLSQHEPSHCHNALAPSPSTSTAVSHLAGPRAGSPGPRACTYLLASSPTKVLRQFPGRSRTIDKEATSRESRIGRGPTIYQCWATRKMRGSGGKTSVPVGSGRYLAPLCSGIPLAPSIRHKLGSASYPCPQLTLTLYCDT